MTHIVTGERFPAKKYIALLRGITVGGKNKIAMPELKLAFEENGITDTVYRRINS
jgi:uncharacterized protein (DUF1697 family)